MKIKTAAKINLVLDVTGRLENGYHTIESVFQTVGLYDEVTVESAQEISISCELPEEFASADPIPCDERNIAYKAAKLFFEENNIQGGCRIHIKKGIPSQAGMGGGSTDAAAVLHCLNVITGLDLSISELSARGKKLGADVPFFFTGGTAYVGGIGEEIASLSDYSGRHLVIAKGNQGVSTAEAYSRIDALEAPVHPKTHRLVRSVNVAPDEAYKYVGNLFEQALNLDEVEFLKAKLLAKGALSACMTGSGSAVFGIFRTRDAAEKCARSLRSSGYFAQACETVSQSFVNI